MTDNIDYGFRPLPILVGVTGSRRFSEWTGTPGGQEPRALFLERFKAILTFLDRKLPLTPKVLLCGGAAGVDLAAVEVVLSTNGAGARPGWSVVMMLPFAEELFLEDFDGAEWAADLAIYRRAREMAANGGPVAIKQLRPLAREPFDDSRLERPDTPCFGPEDLSRRNERRDENVRRWYYEQLGLWLSRYSTVLIAATGDATAALADGARLGGTARVVAFRRTGVADEAAQCTIERSVELLSNSRLDEPDGEHVLLIDPRAESPPSELMPPATLLRPMQHTVNIRDPRVAPAKAVENLYRAPTTDHPHHHTKETTRRGRQRTTRQIEILLNVPLAFERFNERLVAAAHHRRSRKRGRVSTLQAPIFGPETPAQYLQEIRDGSLRDQQSQAADETRSVLRRLIVMFLLAVLMFEIYIEIGQELHPLLIVYVFILCLIWSTTRLFRNRRTQRRAEDYRGLREMMRVQIAWWYAGMDRMVDRVHLRSVDSDLTLVRAAGAAISIWALLRCSRLRTCDGSDPAVAVAPAAAMQHARDWIKGQVEYFRRESQAQRGCKRLAEQLFDLTLLTSSAGLIILALLFLGRKLPPVGEWEVTHFATVVMIALPILPFLAVLGAIGTLWVMTGRPLGVSEGGSGTGGAATRRYPRLNVGLRRALMPISVICAIGGLMLIGIRLASQVFDCATTLPTWIAVHLSWSGPMLFVVAVLIIALHRAPTRTRLLHVRDLTHWQKGAAVLVMVLLMFSVGVVFAYPLSVIMSDHAHPLSEGFRAMIIMESVLLLAGSAMVRYYTERRNHQAQAGHYDDMLRAFRRAEDLLPAADEPLGASAKNLLKEIGEHALDENEAWLKAHRERPPEAIAAA